MSDFVEEPTCADIHVYVVPPLLWNNDLNTAFSDLFKQTVSAGIIRPNVEQNLSEFRKEIEKQLGSEFLPKEYVFCKNVGHSLGRIRPHQETLFQIKEFLPPQASQPEIYVIDLSALAVVDSKPPTPDEEKRSRSRSLSVRPIEPTHGYPMYPGQPLSARGSLAQPGTASANALDMRAHSGSNATYIMPRSSEAPVGVQPGQLTLPIPVSQANSPTHQITSAQYPLTSRSAASWDLQASTSALLGYTGEAQAPVLTTPAMMSGDPMLEAISNSISQQREMLLRLENEQQRRLLQMHVEAEERRRREAEAYERELAQQREKQRELEQLEAELRRCAAESKAAKEEFGAAKKLWNTALQSKESEIETLRQNLDLMRANSSGKENAAMAAAKAELNEVRTQLKNMQDRYSEVQDELLKRREDAEKRLKDVSGEVNAMRRRMSDVYAAVKEPRPVEVIQTVQTIQSLPEPKDTRNIGVGVDFTYTPDPVPSPVRVSPEKKIPPPRLQPLPRILEPLIDDLARLRKLRLAQERRRSELVKRLNQLYVALATRRTQVRDEWKQRYYAAKKQAPMLEDRMMDHRAVLDALMRRAVASMRHCTTGTLEEEEFARTMEKRREVTSEEYRLAEIMLSLTKAIKLRTQAEAEGRLLMAELDRRRGEMSLVKSTSPNRRAYVFSLSPRRQQAATSAAHKTLDEPVRMSRNRESITGLLPPEPNAQRNRSMSSLSTRPLIAREPSVNSTETRRSRSATEMDRLSANKGPHTSGTTSNQAEAESRRSSARSVSPNPV